jgi:hypothetical protein
VKYRSYLRTLVADSGHIRACSKGLAQRHEVGLTLGAITGKAKDTPSGSLISEEEWRFSKRWLPVLFVNLIPIHN